MWAWGGFAGQEGAASTNPGRASVSVCVVWVKRRRVCGVGVCARWGGFARVCCGPPRIWAAAARALAG